MPRRNVVSFFIPPSNTSGFSGQARVLTRLYDSCQKNWEFGFGHTEFFDQSGDRRLRAALVPALMENVAFAILLHL